MISISEATEENTNSMTWDQTFAGLLPVENDESYHKTHYRKTMTGKLIYMNSNSKNNHFFLELNLYSFGSITSSKSLHQSHHVTEFKFISRKKKKQKLHYAEFRTCITENSQMSLCRSIQNLALVAKKLQFSVL